ncbi:cell cycle checkpoint control protein RAD9A-like [Carcharodon carcharias]|uniref:cell cycle checkpoint control protein RAD9A-like n=1 Tax=Carcharodon carcharias TaxID=13397 RepID=UPI001B7F2201|nr:cell cycle checkpoint control protein RAD9A-like [Carcharodon carcharias]
MSEEIDSYMIAMETSAMEEMLAVGNQTPADEGDLPPSPTFPLFHLPKRSHGDNAAPIRTPEADEDAEVTATPPHKKQFRSLFFGSLLSPVGGSCRPLAGHEVLAEASDSDGET